MGKDIELAAWQLEMETQDVTLSYKIDPEYRFDRNRANFKKFKEYLEKVGVSINIEDDFLNLSIIPQKYVAATRKNAGRDKKYFFKDGSLDVYRYSDIVYMLQSMKSYEIPEKIGMPPATFSRHKKKMLESAYFKSLNPDRLSDMDYLKNMPGNMAF